MAVRVSLYGDLIKTVGVSSNRSAFSHAHFYARLTPGPLLGVAMPDVGCDRKRCVYCDRECCKANRLYYIDRRCMTFLERIVVPVPMIERLDTYQERGSKARSWK